MVPPGQEFPVGEYVMLFPDMDPGDYERLVSSIRDHGLLE